MRNFLIILATVLSFSSVANEPTNTDTQLQYATYLPTILQQPVQAMNR